MSSILEGAMTSLDKLVSTHLISKRAQLLVESGVAAKICHWRPTLAKKDLLGI